MHLSTTDPAAHLASTLDGTVDGLQVDRIDPLAETQRYVAKIMATKGAKLDAQERAGADVGFEVSLYRRSGCISCLLQSG